jgi:hypothetical protein
VYDVPPLAQTLSDLQAQIDSLSLALYQWRETQAHLQPMEERLSQLTERCGEIVNRWAETGERHAQAVREIEARLHDWGAIESRLQHDSAERIREFEDSIHHEWKSLREVHEQPVKELREQAAALGETCIAAANLALRGFERSEAKFAALHADLQGQINQLSRDVQAALAALKADPAHAAVGAGAAPFPLESVMRIHDELRESDKAEGDDQQALSRTAPLQLPAAATLSDRMESIERELSSEKEEMRETAIKTERMRRLGRLAVLIAAGVILAGGILGLRVQRRLEAQLSSSSARAIAAERRAESATELANQQIASTRAEAERRITEARTTAQQAQIVSGVLAAPDLVRFNLTGAGRAPRARAQVLWSRSTRAMVLSASRLPAPPTGMTYQLWLVTNTAPVSGGLFVPDSTGRITLVTDNPPTVPRPIVGATVTLEPAGGRRSPSANTILRRVPPPPQ